MSPPMPRMIGDAVYLISMLERTVRFLTTVPPNIRLDEDILKTSFVFVFRRLLQDVLIKTNIFALVIRLQKMSSRCLQDVLVKTNIFILAIRLQDVFKTSSRRVAKTSSRLLQDFFKRSCQNVFKTSSRRLQDVFKTSSRCLAKMSSIHLQDVFKTSYKDIFKMFQDVSLS